MAVNSVLPPYPIFPGADGRPLENGYIYIGVPGFEARSTPKASFFDVDMQIPTGTASGAAIRTTGGFPARNGSPAMFYADGDYSITVTDRNGVLVYSALTSTLALNVGGESGPVLAPDGNLGAPGFAFEDESNTGTLRSATGTVQESVQGVLVSSRTATGTVFAQPVSGTGFDAGVLAVAQPLNSGLTALAALSDNGIVARTGAATYAPRTIIAGAGVSISNGDGVSGNPTITATSPISTSYVSAETEITLNAVTASAHGLGVKPKLYTVAIICKTADRGWAVGDEVDLSTGVRDFNGAQMNYGYADATNVSFRVSAAIKIPNKGLGSEGDIIIANWRFIFRAYA